jgi:hypothetical protein
MELLANSKERRNPSADADGKFRQSAKPLGLVPTWAWAIGYRPSLSMLRLLK